MESDEPSDDGVTVGDCRLKSRSGCLDVFHRGEHVGSITAQGLIEAAKMSDEDLNLAYIERVYDDD